MARSRKYNPNRLPASCRDANVIVNHSSFFRWKSTGELPEPQKQRNYLTEGNKGNEGTAKLPTNPNLRFRLSTLNSQLSTPPYPVTTVPTFSPMTTRLRLCGRNNSKTMIGILLSMQSENA